MAICSFMRWGEKKCKKVENHCSITYSFHRTLMFIEKLQITTTDRGFRSAGSFKHSFRRPILKPQVGEGRCSFQPHEVSSANNQLLFPISLLLLMVQGHPAPLWERYQLETCFLGFLHGFPRWKCAGRSCGVEERHPQHPAPGREPRGCGAT